MEQLWSESESEESIISNTTEETETTDSSWDPD